MKKNYLLALITSTLFFGGCKSTGLESILLASEEPSATDIYSGTVGYCSQSYDAITKYVGNSATQSPEERKAIKESVWNDWQEKRKKMKSNVDGKQFKISQPAAFSRYDEETGLMVLYKGGSVTGENIVERSAVPDNVVFNTYDHWFSPELPSGWMRASKYRDHRAITKREKVALEAFGSQLKRNQSIYVINDYDNMDYSSRTAQYGGRFFSRETYTNKLMGVGFNTKKWFDNIESPVLSKDGDFYFDTRKVDFYKTFGIYPDIGTAYIDINYTFEFVGCNSGQLKAEVKEVVVSSVKGRNEIYRITL